MRQSRQASGQAQQTPASGVGAASFLHVGELWLKRAAQPLTNAWQNTPIEPRGSTLLGISFRPPQVTALGLDMQATLQTLLSYPLQLIRLGAYWNEIEPEPGAFHPDELDWQIDSAEQAGVQIIVCVGPLKTFSYPEFFVPAHQLKQPFPEHTRIKLSDYESLVSAATAFLTRLVERYRDCQAIVAWQLEHEAVDPLGIEHSWRLDTDVVAEELRALRQADPTRPILMNGFLPTSLPVRISQWWQTRDQGDSLAVAQRMADIVGIDFYPRQGLLNIGARTLYLDGSDGRRQAAQYKRLCERTSAHGQKLMISEGQSEPWETITIPPNPTGQGMASCLPEHLITNYNTCMRWSQQGWSQQGWSQQGWSQQGCSLYAYLFWGAEYWALRKQGGDSSYLEAFARILERSN